MAVDPRKLDAMFSRGIIGWIDVVAFAILAAAERDPAEFVDSLPDGCTDAVKELVATPPERLVRLGTAPEEYWLMAEGRRNWQAYFARLEATLSVAPPGLG